MMAIRAEIGRATTPRSDRLPRLSRRWAWVAVPMVAILALEAAQDTVLGGAILPTPVHVALLAVLLLGGASLIAGALFRRFDRQALELQAQNDELRVRGAAMAALQEVSLAVSSLGDLDRILDRVTEQARRLVSGEAALLCLVADDGRLAPRSRSGPAEAFHADVDACPHPDGREGPCSLLGTAAGSGAPAGLGTAAGLEPGAGGGDGDAAARPRCRYVDPAFLGASVVVPLVVGDRQVGSLAVFTTTARAFPALELATLESLAAQAAVAIENARLYQRVRELGMLEERARIAHELHDGLAQVLGYVGTKSAAAISLLDDGRPAEARTQLSDLGEAARSVYVDVREAILGLSTPLRPDRGVLDAVRSYAERYAEAAKVRTVVDAEAGIERVRLAPSAEAQALRLLQEALTNVRKHAEARRVTIGARREEAAFVLEVTDDGRGFEIDGATPADWPHFGLAAMRERAASVNGSVEIESRPGSGTRVRFRLPIAAET